MKLYNLDYKAVAGEAPVIVALKGFNSETDAVNLPAPEGAARLTIRGASDLNSLAGPILAALWEFKAKKGQTAPESITGEDIWGLLEPPPKTKSTPADIHKELVEGGSHEKNSSKKELNPSSDQSTSTAPANSGRKTKEQKMATKGKKKAAKKKAAKKSAKVKGAKRSINHGEKTLKIKALLVRAKGCTRREILDATGWPTVSVQAIAKNLGLKLKQTKEKGSPTQYFGTEKAKAA